MAAVISVLPPYPTFKDVDGDPLESGYIYIGEAGLNPLVEDNQVAVFSDDELTIPVAQPVRTLGGYAIRSGSPTRLYTSGSNYSIAVQNKNGTLVYSSLNNEPRFGAIDSTAIDYDRTQAEEDAGVIPSNTRFQVLNPFRYGFTGAGGAADDTARDAILDVLAELDYADFWLNGAAPPGYPITEAEKLAGVNVVDFSIPHREACGLVIVNRYGKNTVPGTTDMAAAFAAAWTVLKSVGGTLTALPGTYLLGSTWDIVINDGVATAYPVNYRFLGWGVELQAAPAVTGPAVRFTGSYNEFNTDFEGFYFNHRGNSTVAGCIEVLGTHCLHLLRCTVEMHSVGANYYFASFDTRSPGASEDGFNAFWCSVEGCSTRKRSGGESGVLKYGVKMRGAVNAFTMRKNTISNCDYGVYVEPATTTLTLPNSILFEDNAFETINTAAIHVQMTPGQLGPTGWRLMFNRTETTTSFFSLATGGAAANEHSQPPFLLGNYCTAGSVTNWILNPTNYPVSSIESKFPGFGPVVDTQLYQNGDVKIRFNQGKDMYLIDVNNSTDYNRGKIFMGTYCTWMNNSNGIMYIRSGQPTSGTDGTVVGTQT